MLTEKNLAMLAAVGADLSAERTSPTRAGVVDAVLQVAASPNARLVDAAEVALGWLAKNEMLHAGDFAHIDEAAKRLVGYLAERLATDATNPRVKKRLGTFATRLKLSALGSPVWLLETTSERTQRRLLREGNNLNVKWNVYG